MAKVLVKEIPLQMEEIYEIVLLQMRLLVESKNPQWQESGAYRIYWPLPCKKQILQTGKPPSNSLHQRLRLPLNLLKNKQKFFVLSSSEPAVLSLAFRLEIMEVREPLLGIKLVRVLETQPYLLLWPEVKWLKKPERLPRNLPEKPHLNPPEKRHFNPPEKSHFNPPEKSHFNPPEKHHLSPPETHKPLATRM